MDVDKQQKCGEHQKLVGKMQLGTPASGWSNKMQVATETQFVRFGPPQLQQDSSTSRIPPPVPPKPDLPPQPHILRNCLILMYPHPLNLNNRQIQSTKWSI
jgi:hypothetical protein